MVTSSLVCKRHWFIWNNEMPKNPKKLMKIVNIDEDNIHSERLEESQRNF